MDLVRENSFDGGYMSRLAVSRHQSISRAWRNSWNGFRRKINESNSAGALWCLFGQRVSLPQCRDDTLQRRHLKKSLTTRMFTFHSKVTPAKIEKWFTTIWARFALSIFLGCAIMTIRHPAIVALQGQGIDVFPCFCINYTTFTYGLCLNMGKPSKWPFQWY